MRGLGKVAGSAPQRAEPKPPAVPMPPRQNRVTDDAPVVVPPGRLFAADLPRGEDALGLGRPLGLLALLATHAETETPLTIGLLGRPGSGKSFALDLFTKMVEAKAEAGKALVLRLDAADLEGPCPIALANAVHAQLSRACPALAAQANEAAEDPVLASHEAFEKLDAARQKLATARLDLDEAVARRTQLAETLLYETAGTQVDAFARANRGRIRHRLAGLGVAGEPIPAFKDLIHQSLDRDGAKLKFALHALWHFKGQATLLVTSVLLLLAGLGLGMALSDQNIWLDFLRRNTSTLPAAAWFEANMGLLETLRQLAFLGAALALGANLFRAFRLIRLVFRGAALLNADLASRRHDADGQLGHQARRVESLAADVEKLSRRAGALERRAVSATPALAEPSPFGGDPLFDQARRFIAAAGTLTQARPRDGGAAFPERIIVTLDNLETVPPARAQDILAKVNHLFGPGFILAIAVDPARIAPDPFGQDSLAKWIQVPFQVGELATEEHQAALVRALIETSPEAPEPAEDEYLSLDESMSDAEVSLLSDLAPLAGSSARAVKRFVNLYRLTRGLCPDEKGMLALFLALDAGGSDAEKTAMGQALAPSQPEHSIRQSHGGPRLAGALAAIERFGHSLSLAGARRGAAIARLFSFKA
jgi:hypothetical protein